MSRNSARGASSGKKQQFDQVHGKAPPYSSEAEKAVLGAALLNNKTLVETRGVLTEEDFYVTAHRTIFSTMCSVVDGGAALDHVTLGEKLISDDLLSQIGGSNALDNLTSSVVTIQNVGHYIKIVKDKSNCRKIIHAAQQIIADGLSEADDPEEFISKARTTMVNVASDAALVDEGPQHIVQGFNELFDRLQAGKPVVDFLQFGFAGARIRKGVPTVIGARPSNGKTVMCINAAINMARQGHKGLVFNLEDTRDTLWNRVASTTTGINLTKIENGNIDFDSWRLLTDAGNKITSLPLWVYDRVGISSDWIRHASAVHKEKHGLDFVIVDYLQLMREDGRDRYDKFSNAVEGLTILARELNIAVIIVSQIKRPGYAAGKIPSPPTPEELKETGALEQAAKTIFLLHYPAYYDKEGTNPEVDPNELRLETAKQSNGPCGVRMLYCDMARMWTGDRQLAEGYDSGYDAHQTGEEKGW